VIFAALLTWQGVGLVRANDWAVLTDLFRSITRNPVGRWVLFGFWLWIGWHLFVRGWDFFLRSP
jgi:hypothetical protein